jgi:hypothetical protein
MQMQVEQARQDEAAARVDLRPARAVGFRQDGSDAVLLDHDVDGFLLSANFGIPNDKIHD